MQKTSWLWTWCGGCAGLALFMGTAAAAAPPPPTAQQMLELKPTQRFVDYDTPASDRGLKPDLTNEGKTKVWLLRDQSGRIYRRFVDSDRDGVVDQWVYYRDGIEVYRDIDSNSNGRADQFRWLHQSGTRWGVDSNEDGKIDAYRMITAEELTREVMRAIAAKDVTGIDPLLVKPSDAALLGRAVVADKLKDVAGRAREQFAELAAASGTFTAESQWIRLESAVPMLIVGETPDGTRDILVYRDAVAVVQTGAHADHLLFPEIWMIGRCAKIAQLPSIVPAPAPALAQNTVFSNVPAESPAASGAAAGDAEFQDLLVRLQKLDESSSKSAGNESAQARYNLDRAALLEQLAEKVRSPEERTDWRRQQADCLITALQFGESAGASRAIDKFLESIAGQDDDKALAGYVVFRRLSAEYFRKVQAPGSDFNAAQTEWMKDLDAFVNDYPKTDDAAEALSQLAIGTEFTGKEDAARAYYQKLLDGFPNHPLAARARGAVRRLDGIGKPFALTGADLRRGTVDTQSLRGKVLLIDYWSTTCDPWKADLAKLKDLHAKYRGKGFEIIGVSLDSDKAAVAKFVQTSGISWPIIFEPGGLDSAPAVQFGILALPTQFLVDAEGNVASRSVHVSQLEDELKKLIK